MKLFTYYFLYFLFFLQNTFAQGTRKTYYHSFFFHPLTQEPIYSSVIDDPKKLFCTSIRWTLTNRNEKSDILYQKEIDRTKTYPYYIITIDQNDRFAKVTHSVNSIHFEFEYINNKIKKIKNYSKKEITPYLSKDNIPSALLKSSYLEFIYTPQNKIERVIYFKSKNNNWRTDLYKYSSSSEEIKTNLNTEIEYINVYSILHLNDKTQKVKYFAKSEDILTYKISSNTSYKESPRYFKEVSDYYQIIAIRNVKHSVFTRTLFFPYLETNKVQIDLLSNQKILKKVIFKEVNQPLIPPREIDLIEKINPSNNSWPNYELIEYSILDTNYHQRTLFENQVLKSIQEYSFDIIKEKLKLLKSTLLFYQLSKLNPSNKQLILFKKEIYVLNKLVDTIYY